MCGYLNGVVDCWGGLMVAVDMGECVIGVIVRTTGYGNMLSKMMV